MVNQIFSKTATAACEVRYERHSLLRWTSAAIFLFLSSLLPGTVRAEPLQDWRVDSEPAHLDSYRKAMDSNPAWGVAVLMKGDKGWNLAPDSSYTFRADLLEHPDIELLAVEYDTRFVRLLLPTFGKWSGDPSRMGYWCKGGLFGYKRKGHGYSMCTSDFTKSITGGWAAVTGVTSLGQTVEYVAAVDMEAIRKAVRSIDLDAQRNTILNSTIQGGWTIRNAGPRDANAPAARLNYPPELAERDKENRRHLATQGTSVPPTGGPHRGSSSGTRSAPAKIGDRICRTGTLEYTACFNPEFQSSCVTKSAYGQLQGYLEAFSPDSMRIQIRMARYAFDGGIPQMLAAYPTLGGISGQPNGVHWDHVQNWWICGW